MKQLQKAIAFLFCINALNLFAQTEVGVGLGISEYGGDLAKTPFILNETKPGGMAFVRLPFSEKFSVKGMLGVQQISGADANKATSLGRNLSFENTIVDISVLANYSIFEEDTRTVSPYIYAGFGAFKHNPKADINGQTVELQPLGTEGQGIAGYAAKYKLVDFSVPFGVGAKYYVQDGVSAFIDVKATKTFTDYLDDVGSEKFANPTELLNNNGELAYQAAYRSVGEKGWPTDYSALNDEQVRNTYLRTVSDGKDDWYYLISIGASYTFNFNRKNGSRIEQNRRRVPYRR